MGCIVIAMVNKAAGEDRQALLSLAREHNYAVSATQLVRWHRAGLLPRPHQQALGKGQGTQSLYPDGTGEQLLLLCALRQQERRFSYLVWKLWWSGYPVALAAIKQHLQKSSIRLSREMQERILQGIGDELGVLSEQSLTFIEQLTEAHLDYKPLRRVRKRVGKKDFPTFMRLLMDIVAGTFKGYAASYDARETLVELRILAKGLGLDSTFINDDTNIEHYLGKFVIPMLQQASVWFRTLPWEHILPETTDFDLLQARDELRLLFSRGEHITPQQRQLMREYPVWSIALRSIFQATTIEDQAMLLLLWLALRSAHLFNPLMAGE